MSKDRTGKSFPNIITPLTLDPDLDNIQKKLKDTTSKIQSRINGALPEEMQGGEIRRVNIINGTTAIRHNLGQKPNGFLSLTGLPLVLQSWDDKYLTVTCITAQTGALVWIF